MTERSEEDGWGGRHPMPPGTFRVGSIAGSEVRISASWFLIVGLIAVLLAPQIDLVTPGLGAWKYVAGLAFAVLIYLSVLLHEVSHTVMARRYGYAVGAITLHFLGGHTAVDGESRNPRHEFMIAVVGPVTSILLGGLAWLATFVAPSGLPLMATGMVAYANLLVGVLNLLPGLPLDGGRVLRSLVWWRTGSVHRGTIAAGWGGRIVAVLALLWPVARFQGWRVEPTMLDLVIAFVLGLFLWNGATAAMSSARLRMRIPNLIARDLARRTLAVPPDLPLAEAVRRAQEAEAGGIVTVTATGAPVGIVNEAALAAVPTDRQPWMPVSGVARTVEHALSLPADIRGEDLVMAISRMPAPEYLLVEPDGTVFGVLSTDDVDRAFRSGSGR